ncbi:hypothetical protein KC19_VG049200 [Ceratodon purpureus]|uniref:Uncharacterized protein n=1 Tax=Ceratodon purpureus TaxID=3225 RepID=A0A8T0HMD7_CERPU|nr:hypothetical protein KC19_VG049200 [Ceratodon purpureus]
MGSSVANPGHHHIDYCEFDPWNSDISSQDSFSSGVTGLDFCRHGHDNDKLLEMAFPARMSCRPVLDGRTFHYSLPDQWRDQSRPSHRSSYQMPNVVTPPNANVQNTQGEQQFSTRFGGIPSHG